MPDHIHMLMSIPLQISVPSFMGYLKGTLKYNEIPMSQTTAYITSNDDNYSRYGE